MTVLVITDETDRTADRVAAELALRGVPVVTVDTSDFPLRLALSATIGGSFDRWSGPISGPAGELVDVSDVRAVYWRRPTQFEMPEEMSSPERVWAYGEARRGFGGVLAALSQTADGCLWVNDPAAAMRAEYKPVQLQAAQRAGLHVPPTLISSDPDAAYAWAKRLGKPIVYKPLSGVWHADEGRIRALYTTPVGELETLRDPAFGLTAHMLQERTDKRFEARAVIAGRQVFAVRIDAGSEAAAIDWRSDYDALAYEPLELPAGVVEGLLGLCDRLGLVYGAADLAYDVLGRWVFYEINQRGEWFWLAEEAGHPIASALADLMRGGPDDCG